MPLLKVIAIINVFLVFSFSSVSYANHFPYMEDAETGQVASNAGTSSASISGHKFPRVILAETKSLDGPAERFTKYHVITAQGGAIKKAAQIQAKNPALMYFRHVSPRAYQAANTNYCTTGMGMAFETTGAITQGGPQSRGCSFFAGHWLYKAGAKLTTSINSTTKTLKVDNINRFQAGQYVVIYDAPVGSFKNAEHTKIVSKNTSTKTLTLAARGYKSVPKSHTAGAIVAQHVIGQGGGPLNWSYNQSTQCPKDGNGKKFGQVLAEWIKLNHNKTRDGSPPNPNIRVDGILFDADFYFELGSKSSDVNNDLVVDHGVSPSGVNWWGAGLDEFYAAVRSRLPGKIIVAGSSNSRGFSKLNGTQMEAFPASNRTNPIPKYNTINSLISRYGFHMHHNQYKPLHTHTLTKTPTKLYPGHSNPRPTSNAAFRFGLGLTLLEDGYFGTENSNTHPDPWYDEFAVDVNPTSPTFAHAIASNPNNESKIRNNRGWLGSPLGTRHRVYNHATFSANQSKLSNGSFDSNLNGWSGNSVSVTRDTAIKRDGSASLRAAKSSSYKSKLSGAIIKGPKVSLNKGMPYTVAFSAKSSSIREITAGVGSNSERFIVGTKWRRYVMSFDAKKNENSPIKFGVGRENTQIWIDSVYVFNGSANVFRRDFDNGVVVVNATPDIKTVALGSSFKRIKGNQDSINNGATLSNVTIKPWDSAILVRPGGGNGTNENCGTPNYDLSTDAKLFVWKACNGSGRWFVRATAGGTTGGRIYTGDVQTSSAYSNPTGIHLEASDTFVTANSQINFDFKMWSGFQDGFEFTLPEGSTACITSIVGGNIFVGANRTNKGTSACLQ